MIENNLYTANKNYMLLFPTFEYALNEFGRFAVSGGVCMKQDELEGIEMAVKSVSLKNVNPTENKIYYSLPNEPIFLIEKKMCKIKMFQDVDISQIEFWHVIVGEKTGWLINEKDDDLELLRPANDNYQK